MTARPNSQSSRGTLDSKDDRSATQAITALALHSSQDAPRGAAVSTRALRGERKVTTRSWASPAARDRFERSAPRRRDGTVAT